MKHKKTFLGIGWKFPPEFDRESNSVTLISEEADIKESLFILFTTRPGERVMQPEYGCDLSIINFEPTNTNLVALIEDNIQRSILYHEPRIILENVKVMTDRILDGIVDVEIEYTVIKTNNRNNIVFPYYLIEGTDITDMMM
jgi:phage baseplate assembly protein W